MQLLPHHCKENFRKKRQKLLSESPVPSLKSVDVNNGNGSASMVLKGIEQFPVTGHSRPVSVLKVT